MSRKIDLSIPSEQNAIDHSKISKERCTDKRIRREIGKAFKLKFNGLTTREFNGERLWSTKPSKIKNKSHLHGGKNLKPQSDDFKAGGEQ